VQGFDTAARSKYAPLAVPRHRCRRATHRRCRQGHRAFWPYCGQLCLGLFFLLLLIVALASWLGGDHFQSLWWGSWGADSPWAAEAPERAVDAGRRRQRALWAWY